MSDTAKSAFVGFSYQFQVALLTTFFLEEKLFSINQVQSEIRKNSHDFDDIWCHREDGKMDFYVQAKNYTCNKIDILDDKVYFNGKEILLKQNAINIIVTRNSHNLENNSENNGFKYYKHNNLNLIAIHLPSEVISDYIFTKFHPSRINQIMSLANKRFSDFYSCVISESDIPELEFMPSSLLEQTLYIRNLQFTEYKVLFIVGKPGSGKSHLVNELKVSENQMYRFWIRNQDPNKTERLQYKTFLNQLSFKLFGSGRWRTEEEIISRLDSNGRTFYIDGLDHVENYNQSELFLYFDFIDKVNKTPNGKIIVLTRPLNHPISYATYQLQDWSFEETKEYLTRRGIHDFSAHRLIYKITKGYPIIASYIASEWLINDGKLIYTGEIPDLNDYYSIVLGDVKFRNMLSVFTLSTSFFMFDELRIVLENKHDDILGFIGYYPFLFEICDERIALIHDSFNNFISNKIQVDSSLKPRLHEYVKVSLMNAEPRFMARVLSYNLDADFLSALLHKYCRIDEYIKLKNSLLDYESVKQFYYSLRRIYSRDDIVLLSAEEAYDISMIFTILMRDNIEQSYGLLYQFYSYLLKNKIDWKKHIFSSESIYHAFSYFSGNDIEMLYKIETDKGFRKENIIDTIEDKLRYEVDFFRKFETDNYDKYRYWVVNLGEYEGLSSLTNMLVSAYLFNHDEDGMKTIVEDYFDGNFDYATNKLNRFLINNGWKYPRSLNNIFEAKKIILQLGFTKSNNEYTSLTLKEIIQKNASDGSFELNDIINGYIRLANHEGRQIDINSITYYLSLYYEHKDYSVIGLSEIFYELIIRNKITLEYAFKTIKTFQEMSDKGIRHLCYELVNLLGPKYVKDMERIGVLSTYTDYRTWLTALSVEVINSVSRDYVLSGIQKIVYEELDRKRRYKETASLKVNEHINILNSKYSKYFKNTLKQYSIDLVDESSQSENHLNDIVTEQSDDKGDLRRNLDNGIVSIKEKEYYQQIGLDYLTFARCCGGWYEKLPYPDFLDLYDKKILIKDVERILQYIISKSYVGLKFDDERIENGSDRGLLSGIPKLLAYLELEIDWHSIKNAVVKMIDVSLGKI